MLIGMILEPIEYEVKKVRGPGQGGELLIKGQGSAPNVKRLYSPPAAPAITPQPGDRVYLDENGLPVIARPENIWYWIGSLGQLAASSRLIPPTAQQEAQFVNMMAHSGLGAAGQRIGQTMIRNYENMINLSNSNYLFSSNPLVAMAAAGPSNNSGIGPNPGSHITIEFASGETIPVGRMAQEAQKTAVFAEKQLESDVASLDEYNASLSQINDRVVPILKAVSGEDIGAKPAEWQRWYVNLIGYQLNQLQSSDKPTVVEDVPLAYQPQPIPFGQFSGPIATMRMSCFGAGTQVRTLNGLEAIETLKVGDPVLTQSTHTGALAYKPILAVHHNPPSKTFLVRLGDETVVSSEFHRFWKSGHGWVMARDLKEGDLIRTLDGPLAVSRIERGEVVPVYNLDVAEDADFFVGRGGVLVHDNTLPDLRERPFDAAERRTWRAPGRPRRGPCSAAERTIDHLGESESMLSIVLICSVLVAAADGGPSNPADPADLAAYEAAQAKAGRDARAHVRLALWCESHGLNAERMKHLAMAVLYDPSNGLARGLMGLVVHQGKWDRPEVVERQIQDDPAYQGLIREYLERRAATSRKPDSQARLGAWCEQKGLKEQAIAHYSEVVRLDPSRDAAWRRLGYKKQGDRWVKPEELAAERMEAERQRHADKQWESKLKRLRDALEAKDPGRRAKAEAAIAEVTDPRAVPTIWAVFARGSERSRVAAVQMLGQIDGPSASNALAALAVFNASAEVRSRAIETLARRDPRDVLGRLINLVRKPLKYEVRRPAGPGTAGVLFVEGEQYNVRRLYEHAPLAPGQIPPRIFAPTVPFDPYSVQNQLLAMGTIEGWSVSTPGSTMNAEQVGRAMAANPQNAGAILKNAATPKPGTAVNPSSNLVYDTVAAAAYRDMQIASAYQAMEQTKQTLQQSLANDIQAVEATNTQIGDLNGRVLPVLRMMSGQDLGAEPEKWKGWWTDQLGYVYESNIPETKPTLTDAVIATTPYTVGTTHTACFAAGTLVATLDGPRAIESLHVGDRVLAQDTTTGTMAFQPVVAVHRNRPSPTFRIDIDGETIVATGIHRFWKAGKGWTMARDLKPGDSIRVIGGVAEVKSIAADATVPVYNLDVAESRDFFVGTRGFLVHDFSFVHPVLSPFDSLASGR